MRPGRKMPAVMDPLDTRRLPKSGPERVIRWINRFGVVPHGKGAHKPFKLRPWQADLIRAIYGDPRPRSALVSIPRGNGKSALAAALAVHALFDSPEAAPQVLCVASDERQAGIVYDAAKRMIELHPELNARARIYKDAIRLPMNGGELRALPSQEAALQGYRPSPLAIIDELHVVSEAVYESLILAAGKTDHTLVLALSTPGFDRESVMWKLVEHGRRGDDPSFKLIEYAAPDGCALDDEDAWRQANPALGDFLRVEALRANLRTSREAQFRRYRLGQWVGAEGAWIQHPDWMACAKPGDVAPFTRIVMGFDGSKSGDQTALVGCTVSDQPHLFVIGSWSNDGSPGWRVPRREVSETIAAAFDRFDVAELACDPFGWVTDIEGWAERWPGRVIEWPTNMQSRMGPATGRFHASVMERRLTHDGDERLAAHVANCIAKATSFGDVVVKDGRMSPRKIDLAVSAIVALDRAAWHLNNQPQPTEWVFI